MRAKRQERKGTHADIGKDRRQRQQLMAKGAATARKAARKAERRNERILAGDDRVRESLNAGVTEILADWTLVICDDCGLELSYLPGITCPLCSSDSLGRRGRLGTYAPTDRRNSALQSLRKF